MVVKAEVHSHFKSKFTHKFGSFSFSLTWIFVSSSIFFIHYLVWYITSKWLKLSVRVTFKVWFIEVLHFPFCTVYIGKKKHLGLSHDLCLSSKLAYHIYFLNQVFLWILCNFQLLLWKKMAIVFTAYLLWFFIERCLLISSINTSSHVFHKVQIPLPIGKCINTRFFEHLLCARYYARSCAFAIIMI